jgi:hypothetical protein
MPLLGTYEAAFKSKPPARQESRRLDLRPSTRGSDFDQFFSYPVSGFNERGEGRESQRFLSHTNTQRIFAEIRRNCFSFFNFSATDCFGYVLDEIPYGEYVG